MDRDKILYSIKEALGILSDDRSFDLPDSLIMYEYEIARATFIEQLYSKGGRYNDVDLLQFVKVTLEQTNNTPCPNVPSRCKILRSKEPLPSSFIYVHGRSLIDNVGSSNPLSRGFEVIEYNRVRDIRNTERIVKNKVSVFVLNDYVYIFGDNNPSLVTMNEVVVSGIFESPDAVIQSGSCYENCNNYPMKNQYHTYVMEMIFNKLISKLSIPKDEVNDSNSNVQMQAQAPAKKQKASND